MQAEIITIGTEILLGNIQNTNSRYLAEKLAKCGIDLYHITTVGDNKNRITTLLRQSLQRSDLVITTGGLGPTKDDLTREAIAETLNIPLQLNEELLKELKQFFSARNYNMTKNNIKQARIPKDAKIIRNSEGTAPGFICRCKQGEKNIISLPGVPREMKNMFTSLVIPYLKKIQDSVIKSRVLHFIGVGESTLETRLNNKMLNQSNPTLALLADEGEVKIRITAKAISDEKAEAMIKATEKKIRNILGKYIYGTDEDTLPRVIGRLLKSTNLTLSLAESCTGGLLGKRFTDIPGSSTYFRGGVIAYSNQIKQTLLNVEQNILADRGAVSRETAIAMATGVLKKFHSDIGLSITGIAGPGGGTKEKPVGLVYIGLKRGEKEEVKKYNFGGNRKYNRWLATQKALYLLFKLLKTRR